MRTIAARRRIKLKKWILIPLLILAVGVTLTGCGIRSNVGTTPAPTAQATVNPTNSPAPVATAQATASPDAAGGATAGMTTEAPMGGMTAAGTMTPAEAGRLAERISEAVERLSEVDDAQVVIAGNRAAVALEFDDQYKGGVDDRLRGIVRERIDSVISGVTDISITADTTLMDALETLGERLDTMSDMNALQSDLDAIIRRIEGA